jgi:hypothetical protein
MCFRIACGVGGGLEGSVLTLGHYRLERTAGVRVADGKCAPSRASCHEGTSKRGGVAFLPQCSPPGLAARRAR